MSSRIVEEYSLPALLDPSQRTAKVAWLNALKKKSDAWHRAPFAMNGVDSFIYTKSGDKYLLYSVGVDGDDDHNAKPADTMLDDGDLSLESFASPSK